MLSNILLAQNILAHMQRKLPEGEGTKILYTFCNGSSATITGEAKPQSDIKNNIGDCCWFRIKCNKLSKYDKSLLHAAAYE